MPLDCVLCEGLEAVSITSLEFLKKIYPSILSQCLLSASSINSEQHLLTSELEFTNHQRSSCWQNTDSHENKSGCSLTMILANKQAKVS